jgi:NADH-quinone oxidoreductase subunit N
LVVLAIATSAVSLYYYLQVLKQIYIAEAADGTSPYASATASRAAIIVAALGVVLLGCLPNLLLERLRTLIQLAGL